MRLRYLIAAVSLSLPSLHANGQVFTLAGGNTTGAATKHDYIGVELNLPWRERVWEGGWI